MKKEKLSIAVPKGSLEKGVFSLFEKAELPIQRKDERDYKVTIDDPRISEVILIRPPEIAQFVAQGDIDLGITGQDWIEETGSDVREVADLNFSKVGWNKVKIVLATNEENPVTRPVEIKSKSTVVTEYQNLTRRYLNKFGKFDSRIFPSYGATEAKVPRFYDYLVDVTETGKTLKANGIKILDVIMESSTKLIANHQAWQNLKKQEAINEINELLRGVIAAQGRVLLKMNVSAKDLKRLLEILPACRYPTISSLKSKLAESWYAVETVAEKRNLNTLISAIKKAGARDILEVDIFKMIP